MQLCRYAYLFKSRLFHRSDRAAAYAFVEAIVVVRASVYVLFSKLLQMMSRSSAPFQTPMGALSVVICAVLSSIFLKEKLSLFGWLGCSLCIVSAVTFPLQCAAAERTGVIRGAKPHAPSVMRCYANCNAPAPEVSQPLEYP